MFLGQVRDFEIHIWKLENGRYAPADEREVARPAFSPIIVFHKRWHNTTTTPILYDNQELYFVYDDALTHEQIKERVELMGDGYECLIKDAETMLSEYFTRGRND
jgi:hypothetical protein